MTRLWTVVIRETLDSGFQGKSITVSADDIHGAVAKAQDQIDEQPEHAHRYEVVSAALATEAE